MAAYSVASMTTSRMVCPGASALAMELTKPLKKWLLIRKISLLTEISRLFTRPFLSQ
jgi:hypothetical protein